MNMKGRQGRKRSWLEGGKTGRNDINRVLVYVILRKI